MNNEDISPLLIHGAEIAPGSSAIQESQNSSMPPVVPTLNSLHNGKDFVINRRVYTQDDFDQNYGARSTSKTIKQRIKYQWNRLNQGGEGVCSRERAKKLVYRFFPFINIMRKYQWSEWLLNDVISGITVGIMHIPQGMAYAMLANLPPVYGLYTSFFPSLFYFFFGSSRHISLGTVAVVSLMTGTLLQDRFPSPLTEAETSEMKNTTNSTLEDELVFQKVEFACSATLIVGLMQLLMGIFQLGYLTRYLSDPMIAGFTFGTALHVFTSQVPHVFGVKFSKPSGIFSLPKTYYMVAERIPSTNPITFGISAICIVLLVVFKLVINPKVQAKIKAPIPIELILVISGTVASHFLQLNELHEVYIVGDIPHGMPQPSFPDLISTSIIDSIGQCFAIAVIAFSICLSLAKIFAKKHHYEVNANQEFLAYGITNIMCSIFRCYPAGASLSRSSVQEGMDGKTQLVSLVSGFLLIFVLLFIGPLFRSVPSCVLASIIIVALKSMFLEAQNLPRLWKFSGWDFWNWVLTALAVTVLGVDYGLCVGISFSVLSVILRTQSPVANILGRVQDTDVYKNYKAYQDSHEISGIKIFRYEGALFYACAEHFRDTLYHKTQANPRKILVKRSKLESKLKKIEKQLKTFKSYRLGDDVETGKCCCHSVENITHRIRRRMSRHHDQSVPRPTLNETTKELSIEKAEENGVDALRFSPSVESVSTSLPVTGAQTLCENMTEEEAQLETLRADLSQQLAQYQKPAIHHIILDCSTWGYIDFMGVEALNQVICEYKEVGISIFLANPKCGIREMLSRLDFHAKHDPRIIYVSVHDAVLSALYENLVNKPEEQISECIPEHEYEIHLPDNFGPVIENSRL